jgi:addiction module HigA family antidote
MTTPRSTPGEALLAAGVTPTPPGAYLADFIRHMKATVDQVAEATGVPPHVLRMIIENQQKIDQTIAARLSGYTGLSTGFWLNLQSATDLYLTGHAGGSGHGTPSGSQTNQTTAHH